jgi:hypothetical protein
MALRWEAGEFAEEKADWGVTLGKALHRMRTTHVSVSYAVFVLVSRHNIRFASVVLHAKILWSFLDFGKEKQLANQLQNNTPP